MGDKLDKHIQLLSIFWIAHGGLMFLGGLFVFGLLFGLSFLPELEPDGESILRVVAFVAAGTMWLLSFPKIIAGLGLLRRAPWARILTLVLAFLALFNVPIGTALGAYSLVILLREDTAQLFGKGA
jgi:hypothetical protein